MPVDPEIQAKIDEARRIIREDKILASHKELHARFDKHFPADPADAAGNPADPPEGAPPPPDPIPPKTPSKPRKTWWPDNDS